MSTEPTSKQILDTPMDENDSGADTVRGYLVALAAKVWEHGECFSGKRPFGNSSWECDIYAALAKAGYIVATFDEDGYLDEVPRDEERKADALVAAAIKSLASAEPS